jgi:Pyridoxamine 5'-phosphate oxidase
MEITNLGKADGLPPVDWAAVADKLAAGSAPTPDAVNSRTTWLSTINQDGSPHVTAVGALWLDGAFWFQTGAGTRKGRNVARDPRCSVAVSVRDADVVIEGDAVLDAARAPYLVRIPDEPSRCEHRRDRAPGWSQLNARHGNGIPARASPGHHHRRRGDGSDL